jgi:hypothetical protein
MFVYLFWTALTIYFFYVITRVLPKDYWAWLMVPAALVYGICVWTLYNVENSHQVALPIMLGMAAIFGVWAFIGEFRTAPDNEEA